MPVEQKRSLSLDIIRIIAFISVPCVHFFLHNGFYGTPVVGGKMYAMTIVRNFFMICVPMFMIITGYLMVGKKVELNKKSLLKFYFKLSKVLSTYLLATVILLLFRIYYSKEDLSLFDCIINILTFQQYSWYVNMYIGTFLLIPLLNAMWHSTDSKESHFAAVIIMCLLTVVPTVLNIYDLTTKGALTQPWKSTTATLTQIYPGWWGSIYPITYYFIGAYMKSHVDASKLHASKIALMLIFSVMVFGIYNIWRSYSVIFSWGQWCDWPSLQNTVNATLVFLLVLSFHVPDKENFGSKALKSISNLTFGAYLLSWGTDTYLYPHLVAKVPVMQDRFAYMPLYVGTSVLMALTGSFLVNIIKWLINKLITIIKNKIKPPVKPDVVPNKQKVKV